LKIFLRRNLKIDFQFIFNIIKISIQVRFDKRRESEEKDFIPRNARQNTFVNILFEKKKKTMR